MLTSEEKARIENLLNSRISYLNFFNSNSPEYKALNILYNNLSTAYNKWGIALLETTPMPTKPLDAYIVGGMANGIAGVGAGVSAFFNAKAKEERYNEAMLTYNSKLSGFKGATDELVYYYGNIVNLLNTNPKASELLQIQENIIKKGHSPEAQQQLIDETTGDVMKAGLWIPLTIVGCGFGFGIGYIGGISGAIAGLFIGGICGYLISYLLLKNFISTH